MEKQITLSYLYDFDRALERLSGDPVNYVAIDERFVRIPMKEGNNITLRGTGTKEAPKFQLENALNESQIKEVMSIFHLDKSLDEVHSHFMETDLAPIFEEHAGTPLVRSYSLYGTLLRSIIHQQLNMSFANTLSKRFVEKYGSESEGVWRYPSPDRIAELEVAELRELQFSTRKAEYLIGLSQSVADGSLDLERLRQLDDEEVMAELVTYRGVGPWTAQSFLMSGLGRPNLFPLADIGLQNALQKLWGMERKPTKDEITARYPDWSPYLSYAALYLWRSIE
ncbi:DNA-3-methyladenine glycosylase family protein [Sporosarcina sp. CAU 1771]